MEQQEPAGNVCVKFDWEWEDNLPSYGYIRQHFEDLAVIEPTSKVRLPDTTGMPNMYLRQEAHVSKVGINNAFVGEGACITRTTVRECTFDNCVFDVDATYGKFEFFDITFVGCTFILFSTDKYRAIFNCCTFKDCTFVVINDTLDTLDNAEHRVWNRACRFYGGIENYDYAFRSYYDPKVLPEESTFTAWKKVRFQRDSASLYTECLLELCIPSMDRIRDFSGTSNKIRVGHAQVIALYEIVVDVVTRREIRGNRINVPDGARIFSRYDFTFTYTIGGVVIPDNFNPDPFIQCSRGIHCFVDEFEAASYDFR